MGKRVTGRPDLSSPRGPATIIVVGTRSEDALCLKLRKAFDGARFFPDLATSDIETADLAVGIFEGNDYLRLYAFAERAHTTGVPGLSVALWPYEMLIGPLALAGRAGCARCAFERMAAASEASTQAVDALALDTVAGVTGPVLVREVRAILRRGVERSHLLDHVLAVDAGTLEATLHRVIPLPRCAVCGGAAAFPSVPRKRLKLSPEDAPEVVLRALAGLLDQRTGIISGAFLEPPASADLTFPFVMTAAPPRIKDDDGTLRQLPLGWGKGL